MSGLSELCEYPPEQRVAMVIAELAYVSAPATAPVSPRLVAHAPEHAVVGAFSSEDAA